MSREHYFTNGLFPNGATVRGASWCPDGERTLPAPALVANILCRDHNAQLSELDQSAIDAWELCDDLSNMHALRSGRPNSRWSLRQYTIDGLRFQRWCFKLMANLLFSGNYRAAPSGWRPDLRLVRRIFGVEPFDEGCGIGVLASVGEQVENTKRLSFDMAVGRDGEQTGGVLTFRGLLRIACSWNQPLDRAIQPPEHGGTFGHVIPPHGTVKLGHNLELRFNWSGTFAAKNNSLSREVLSRFKKKKQ
ncbi:hypothetical protein [Myxococcus sp. AB056]|uniref:hypothetical protein n=1 Tax=Myxococcus sp. AB056 TaxID=2562792 RepID=UPI001146C8CC|nr:hypothetical protein [Myxococcus sp. AB056]